MAPQLSSNPVDQLIENDFTLTPSVSLTYALPIAFDAPGDTVTTTMSGLTSFMTYDQASH